jgi:hypothetical protein
VAPGPLGVVALAAAQATAGGAREAEKDSAAPGAPGERTAAAPPRRTYTVWKASQRIHARPLGFSAAVKAPRGTVLEVLGEDGAWSHVGFTIDDQRRTGWAQLVDRQLAAGEKAESLRETTMSSVAMASKQVEEMKAKDAKAALALPDATAALGSLDGASLDEEAVNDFLKAGGLRLPGRGRS